MHSTSSISRKHVYVTFLFLLLRLDIQQQSVAYENKTCLHGEQDDFTELRKTTFSSLLCSVLFQLPDQWDDIGLNSESSGYKGPNCQCRCM